MNSNIKEELDERRRIKDIHDIQKIQGKVWWYLLLVGLSETIVFILLVLNH